MSLAHGRTYLAVPGPSVMPDRVLRAMHRAAPNIYSGELPDMVPGIVDDLKAIVGTKHEAAIYIANGHGAWEAALANVVAAGDLILVLATGRFGHGWAEMAECLGVDVEVMEFGMSSPVDVVAVAERLAQDKTHRIRAVLAVHIDTSTSVRSDIARLGAAMKQVDHPALLMVDCVASLGCDRFEMDAWGADVVVAGCQKGLMTPPGLGFVFFNDKAAAARNRMERVSRYWDWRPRVAPDLFYEYFDGTAPTHHLYGLREALDMMAEEGRDAIFRRHDALARAVWAAVETWETPDGLRLNVGDPDARARSVTTVHLDRGRAEKLRRWTETRTGLTLGIGLGFTPMDDVFRIGHMGHVNAQMILGAMATIEAGMQALGVPHKSGAVDAAAAVIAEAA